ncbi:hypothetical protein SRHO_G00009880 [Serrasalmus rhombeus]
MGGNPRRLGETRGHPAGPGVLLLSFFNHSHSDYIHLMSKTFHKAANQNTNNASRDHVASHFKRLISGVHTSFFINSFCRRYFASASRKHGSPEQRRDFLDGKYSHYKKRPAVTLHTFSTCRIATRRQAAFAPTVILRRLTVPDMFTDIMDYELEEDKLGIPIVPGTVTLKKDAQNLIGISIGGGAQYCPCLYIVQVFDNTPAALEGTLAAGDEITGVNGKTVKGKTKVEVAKMIQAVQGEAVIHYNKLQADPKQGKSLDIVLKKVKHRLVENMSSGTADALGLSRAILCNDGLVKRLEELEKTAELYKGLMEHSKRLLRAFFELSQTHRAFGDVFSVIGVREPQAAASEAFVKFAEAHRNIEKYGIQLLKTIKPMLHDLNTYLHKAIPDTRLTIRKYLDVKFEYLSYCLKVKEMDDEEYSCIALGEPLYRVSTGNYEYRLILRCRQEARSRFAKMRKDVLEKIELLDQKHVQDIVFQLQRFVSGMSRYYDECYAVLKEADVFPIEVDLSRTMINYSSQSQSYEDDEEEEEDEREKGEGGGSAGQAENGAEKLIDDE